MKITRAYGWHERAWLIIWHQRGNHDGDNNIWNYFRSLINKEIEERKKFWYPPFTRLIKITIKNIQESRCEKTAIAIAELLAAELDNSRIFGPQAPAINRIRNNYLQEILIKIERNKMSLSKVKAFINNTIITTINSKAHLTSAVIIDVDPN